jgi:hypothetical protein
MKQEPHHDQMLSPMNHAKPSGHHKGVGHTILKLELRKILEVVKVMTVFP